MIIQNEFVPISNYAIKNSKIVQNNYSSLALNNTFRTVSPTGEKEYTIMTQPYVLINGQKGLISNSYSNVISTNKSMTYYELIPSKGIVVRDYSFIENSKKYTASGDFVFVDNDGTLERLKYPVVNSTKSENVTKKFADIKVNDIQLMSDLGESYYSKKEYINAIEQFKKVLEVEPEDYKANMYVGNSYVLIAEELMKLSRTTNDLSNDVIESIKNEAIDNYKEAIPYYEKALKIKPDNVAMWTNLGVVYINVGMKIKGEEAFKKADELSR